MTSQNDECCGTKMPENADDKSFYERLEMVGQKFPVKVIVTLTTHDNGHNGDIVKTECLRPSVVHGGAFLRLVSFEWSDEPKAITTLIPMSRVAEVRVVEYLDNP